MSFIENFESIIEKSNNDICNITLDEGITLYNYESNFKLLSSKKLIDGNYSFADYWFDINKLDILYGLINTKDGSIIHYYINDRFTIKSCILKYNPNRITIKFPYIKNINGVTHIIYFEIHKGAKHYCTLIHHYKKNNKWVKDEIDSMNYMILSNFVVIFNGCNPSIFYLKIINGNEEVFYSTFDLITSTWSSPTQITNTSKEKVYLSVIKSSNNFYNIIYSENNLNSYYCSYINGYIDNNKFISNSNITISKSTACVFPHLIEYKNNLYIQWLEYHDLYTSISRDFGETWSEKSLFEDISNIPFSYYSFKSNNLNNTIYNLTNIFLYEKSLKILGVEEISNNNNKYEYEDEYDKYFNSNDIYFSGMKSNSNSNIKNK